MKNKPARLFIKNLVILLLVAFCFYYTNAKAEKELTDSPKFKGYEVKFDYKGHPKEREIAYKYLKQKYSDPDLNVGIKPDDIGIDLYDIDGDGKKEILVYLNSSGFCGSAGCAFYIIRLINKGSSKEIPIDGAIVVQEFIKILENKRLDYHNILFYDRFGQPSAIWQWQGDKYKLRRSLSGEH